MEYVERLRGIAEGARQEIEILVQATPGRIITLSEAFHIRVENGEDPDDLDEEFNSFPTFLYWDSWGHLKYWNILKITFHRGRYTVTGLDREDRYETNKYLDELQCEELCDLADYLVKKFTPVTT